jgi:anaerobic selenocysteine-containing dehydrogenase
MADIVLPATTFLEHDDFYKGSGHTFLQVTRKVVEPLGEARSNHWVLCELAKRLGADHPGFRMTEWELMDATLKASGLPDAETLHRGHWHDCSLSFESMHFLDGFGHPDGKFRFKPDWNGADMAGAGLPALPDYAPINDTVDDTYPFRLVTAPARQFLNTTFTETPGSQGREVRPTALIHPDDCARLGIAKDQRVRVGSRQAAIVVHARPFDGLQRGVVVIESIWPNGAFEEGLGVNALVSAEPGPPKGGGTFHDTAVWLRPA